MQISKRDAIRDATRSSTSNAMRNAKRTTRNTIIFIAIACILAVILRSLPFFVNGTLWTNLPDSLYEIRLTEIPFESVDNFTADGYVINWGILYTLIVCAFKFMNILPALPIVLMCGTIICAYFIGKRFSVKAGIITALFLAVLNGSLYYRSLIGGIDHHIGEIFFSTLFILCYLNTIDKRSLGWLVASCLSGTAMMLVMTQCIIVPAILTLVAIICYFVKHEDTQMICKVNIITSIFLMLMMFLFRNSDNFSVYYYGWMLPLAFLGLAVVNFIFWFLSVKSVKRPIGAIILGALVALAITVFTVTGKLPELIYNFTPNNSGISEMVPYSVSLFLVTFGLSFILLFLGIFVLGKYLFKDKDLKFDYIFLGVWFIVMLYMTICHCRWEYYWVLPCTVIIGIGVCGTINWLKTLPKNKDLKVALHGIVIASLVICVLLCCYTGCAVTAEDETKWQDVGNWLQSNTPDQPYYENGQPTYRILSNWEYGHYIEVWGHRCPYSNPFQSNADSEGMLITGNNIPSDIEYVILDSEVYNSYKSMQLFGGDECKDIPLEESAMYNVYENGNALYDKNGIKIFTIDEWNRVAKTGSLSSN